MMQFEHEKAPFEFLIVKIKSSARGRLVRAVALTGYSCAFFRRGRLCLESLKGLVRELCGGPFGHA